MSTNRYTKFCAVNRDCHACFTPLSFVTASPTVNACQRIEFLISSSNLAKPLKMCPCTLGPKRYFLNPCALTFEIWYFFTKSQMYRLPYCTIFVKRALDECSCTFLVRTFCVLSHRACTVKVRKPVRRARYFRW